ncbi:ATP-binding cassette domain-containing protein [Fundidesulfovibrio terrae]|uniref:ATP-binding cassette domain-containing protein n=1 Tax=Fundidesulfovibrio terrae TaxID=2922866 RepID=UPI001FAF5444|nr:ATP-binding cassette domain-containing protein [Fundidesulfovibrio terrae]
MRTEDTPVGTTGGGDTGSDGELAHGEALAYTPDSMTLTAGRDKSGNPEAGDVVFRSGEITALLGPTGSGKSRFLSDIESLACGDTPTGRTLKLDGRAPDADERFALQGRLVAQLTQNMNFVLDMGVRDFVLTHAKSREVEDPEAAASRVLQAANALAGEPFGPGVQLTQLSGGQSRALMIADTALLSWSPVLLIDEIENAGVDKRRALDLLLASDKIIVIATHDPVLALSADRRLVFEHGAVKLVQTRTGEEERVLARLEAMEGEMSRVRGVLRRGERLLLA